MIRRALAIALAWAALAGVAHAAVPTVAVMPFKDLSGGRGAVGEAIRETVTSDLEGVPGLKVVERSNLDRVLAEQNLQSARSDLDPLSTVKVGRLLGASLIVAGAYQRAAQTVRLTARFVKVETGEVVGTAKVDGPAADFLRLQDRVTTALLRSAGISGPAVQRFARRTRPKLKSLKSVELYGDAVMESDDKKKENLLKLALNEDPNFVYAARDLDALEKRMKGYEKSAARAQDQKLVELREQMAKEKDPQKRSTLIIQVLNGLQASRRWHTLARTSRALLAGPLPPPAVGAVPTGELVAFYLVQSESMLRQRDALLADGEKFLKRYPSSMYFKSIEGIMQSAIEEKRREEAGRGAMKAALAELSSRDRWDLCRVARVYRAHAQNREAQRLFRACLTVGLGAPAEVLHELIQVDVQCADFTQARHDLDALEKSGHDDPSYRHALEMSIPADG